MPEAKYFRPKHWDRFQHYRDRQPPWIKLHRQLLRDHDFLSLTTVQQCHLMKLWLLYADVGRPLPWNCSYIAGQLQEHSNVIGKTLERLLSSNFIELCDKDASMPLAERYHRASQETETETETEKSTSKPVEPTGPDGLDLGDPPGRPNGGGVPSISRARTAKDMATAWNEIVSAAGLPRVEKITDSRTTACYARFRKELDGDMERWRQLLYQIRASDFLMGRAERSAGHHSFTVTFDWVLKPANMVKIIEGNYDNRKPDTRRPGVPDIDEVMG